MYTSNIYIGEYACEMSVFRAGVLNDMTEYSYSPSTSTEVYTGKSHCNSANSSGWYVTV